MIRMMIAPLIAMVLVTVLGCTSTNVTQCTNEGNALPIMTGEGGSGGSGGGPNCICNCPEGPQEPDEPNTFCENPANIGADCCIWLNEDTLVIGLCTVDATCTFGEVP